MSNNKQKEGYQMIEEILSENLVKANETFKEKLFQKINEKINSMKVSVGKSMFKESKADDLWNSAADEWEKKNALKTDNEKSTEISDDEARNNSVHQIKSIHDEHHNPLKQWDPSKSRDENEAENPNDKRVQGGLAARTAKGENKKENQLITYHHGDGSKSVIDKDTSNLLFHTLSGAAGAKATIKKDTREKLLNLIHKNPQGLQSGSDVIKKLLSSGSKKHFEKSIYNESRELSEVYEKGDFKQVPKTEGLPKGSKSLVGMNMREEGGYFAQDLNKTHPWIITDHGSKNRFEYGHSLHQNEEDANELCNKLNRGKIRVPAGDDYKSLQFNNNNPRFTVHPNPY